MTSSALTSGSTSPAQTASNKSETPDLPSPTQFLRDELARRIERNPRYSMRAFANALGLNIGSLSSLLSGKRPLTMKTALRLCDALGMGPGERLRVLDAVAEAQAREKRMQIARLSDTASKIRYEIDEETFRVIGDWYHYAILQLVRTRPYRESGFASESRWIASQLGISETEAALAVRRLESAGLLRRNGDGRLERTREQVTTADRSVTSAALKRLQRQVREKAIHSLENDPIEARSMTSMTIAVDPSRLRQARIMIDEFQEKLGRFLEGSTQDSVYQISISLFPLQTKENPA